MSIDGKVALVTGASRGIGAAIARELAARGAAVAVNHRDSADAAEQVVKEITAAGGRALAVRADVTDAGAVREMAAQVEAGLGPVDILVLNAHGFDEKVRALPLEVDVEALASVVSGQIRATMLPVQAFVPGMVERGGGSVVFISALIARDPWPMSITHGAAKAAMELAAKVLARTEARHGVRVNTVIAGITRTQASDQIPQDKLQKQAALIPMQRIGEPEDVARAVAALAGDDTAYVTGAFVPACGGALII
ncbi:SDR family oxidoreductase [Sphaerisporangium sp. NPDC005288]|uniref:SDR family NAD(P)-dependent oxidoreductase n=1 Tax=Sphaerisporangium sp. NPDC005288 TaxID=3155114 RepID=UPI0033A28D22